MSKPIDQAQWAPSRTDYVQTYETPRGKLCYDELNSDERDSLLKLLEQDHLLQQLTTHLVCGTLLGRSIIDEIGTLCGTDPNVRKWVLSAIPAANRKKWDERRSIDFLMSYYFLQAIHKGPRGEILDRLAAQQGLENLQSVEDRISKALADYGAHPELVSLKKNLDRAIQLIDSEEASLLKKALD
ncbi:MAG: hypothetical protein EKK47_10365 [Burkholderiales bacterium]|nr:MAG: hypothetical protein EKK47_10365 [Burkholderiales bacterium]